MIRHAPRSRALGFLGISACAALCAALGLSSCKTLPPESDPAYRESQRVARGSLPSDAALFAAFSPASMPKLSLSLAKKLGGADSGRVADILKRTRVAYAAFSPGSSSGGLGTDSMYALLSGSYQGALMRAALSSAKGVAKSGEWFTAAKGMKIAVVSDGYILITNADMASFLARLRKPAMRAEAADGESRPLDEAEARRSGGLAILAPSPGSKLLPEILGASSGLPIESLFADMAEKEGQCRIDFEFAFQAESAAKAFAPAARMIVAAAKRLMGISGTAQEITREGPVLSARGLTVSPEALSDLAFKLSGGT